MLTVFAFAVFHPGHNLLNAQFDEFRLDHRATPNQFVEAEDDRRVGAEEGGQHRLQHYPIAVLLGGQVHWDVVLRLIIVVRRGVAVVVVIAGTIVQFFQLQPGRQTKRDVFLFGVFDL